ncbi:Fur family transcriptional regulator [Castellaniella hirudinis]|uniref:Fur family transcriptional regulator n=1 Tax=Castellaniella hirudinis TaxID=1144617 RepID=A0ABV8RWL4_9BURK
MNRHAKLTGNQRRILQALSRADSPLGAYALLERVGLSGPAQVYRALDKLMALGLVRRLESLNAYVRSSERDASRPTAFAICDQCGHIDQLVDGSLAQCLQRLANGRAFEFRRAVIEVHGKCSACCASEQAGHD